MSDRDPDELLRRVLADEAAGVDPEPDWDDVRRRAAKGAPRLPAWLPAAAVVVVVALAVGAGILVRDAGEDEARVSADDPTSTTTSDPTTTVPSTAPVSPPPWTIAQGPDGPPLLQDVPAGEPLGEDEVVAAIEVPGDREFTMIDVVVLSKSTGEVLRTLASGYDTVEGGVYDLTLSPDQRTVFWVVATSACTSRIDAAPVDGSAAAEPLRDDADGIAFGLDGSYAIETGDVCVGPAALEVGDLDGGPTTVYTASEDQVTMLESMALGTDTIAVVAWASSSAPPTSDLLVIDRAGGEVTRVPSDDRTWYSGVQLDHDGRFVAMEGCCDAQPPAGPYETATLITLDGAAVTDRQPLEAGVPVFSAARDRTGDLLVIAGEEVGDLYLDDRLVRTDVFAVAN